MKINIEDQKDAQKLIKVEVEAQRVDAALEDIYNGIQKTANIPGYRPGKAPRDMVKTHYNKAANEEVLNRLIWDCYREAITEKNINPVGYPVIVDVDFNEGKPLNFSVKVETRPAFKLKVYKGIKVKEKLYEASDEDVDNALKQMQESMAEYKNIKARPIAKGDYIVCDYECFSGGKQVDKKDKLWLYISDKLQPKELLALLLGAELGTTKETEVSYPKDYEYKELAGQSRLYKVTPKEIKEKILPEINDELAKSTGHFNDMSELKADLKKNILSQKKLESARDVENQIYKILLESHAFDVPASLVENQALRLVQETKQRLAQQGYKKEDLDTQDDKLKESVKGRALDNVRLFFIMQSIAQQEKIEVVESDIDKRVAEIASHTKEDQVKVRQRLKENNLLDSLKEQALHDKVSEFLIVQAKRDK
ncbi:MAG: trigger factor [Candidatus Orphnella occulta]|nr:trigger factor [Candidatus Orphnella occulta]